MRFLAIGATALALGALVGTAALAQTGGQMGPAKTPGGSMPAAPSNSTAGQGGTMRTDDGMSTGQRMAPRKMKASRKKMRRAKKTTM